MKRWTKKEREKQRRKALNWRKEHPKLAARADRRAAKSGGRPISNPRVREIMEQRGCSRVTAYKILSREKEQ